MPLETISQYFALQTRYLYEFAQPYSHWLIVPTLMPSGRYQVALLNPDGEWHPCGSTYLSADAAIKVGKAAIDLWMAELEGEG